MARLMDKSPAELFVASRTSTEQSALASTALESLKKAEKDLHAHFSFALPPKAKEKLLKRGLYLSPFSLQNHSHPVCKTLENNLLYRVLPSRINNTFSVISIKEGKLSLLRRAASAPLLDCINRFVTSKDLDRYDNATFFEKAANPFFSDEPFSSESMRDLLPKIVQDKLNGKRNRRNFFIHDEIHYWSKGDIMHFLDVVQPNKVLATIVFPPEILKGHTGSLNPWCYEFEIVGNRFSFFPDGRKTESYTQNIESGELLCTSKIRTKGGETYCVDILYSSFAHHLIQISRCNLLADDLRYFDDFSATDFSKLNVFGGDMPSVVPIEHALIMKVIVFLRCLKNSNIQSGIAKLQQVKYEVEGYELHFFENLINFAIQTTSSGNALMPNLKANFLNKMMGLMPGWFRQRSFSFRTTKLSEFINEIKPYSFSIKPHMMHIDVDWVSTILFSSLSTPLEERGLPSSKVKNHKYCIKRAMSYYPDFNRIHASHCQSLFSASTLVKMLGSVSYIEICFIIKKVAEIKKRNYLNYSDMIMIDSIMGNEAFLNCPYHFVKPKDLLKALKEKFWGIRKDYPFLTTDPIAIRMLFSGHIFRQRYLCNGSAEEFYEYDDLSEELKGHVDHLYFNGIEPQVTIIPEEPVVDSDDLAPEIPEATTGPSAAHSALLSFFENSSSPEILPVQDSTSEAQTESYAPVEGDSFAGLIDISIKEVNDIESFREIPVPGDGNCFFHCIDYFEQIGVEVLKNSVTSAIPEMNLPSELSNQLISALQSGEWPDRDIIKATCIAGNYEINVHSDLGFVETYSVRESRSVFHIKHSKDHFSILLYKEGCVIQAIADSLGRSFTEILAVCKRPENKHLIFTLIEGSGVSFENFKILLKVFDVHGFVYAYGGCEEVNPKGFITRYFDIEDDHVVCIPKAKDNISPTAFKHFPADLHELKRKFRNMVEFEPSYRNAEMLQTSFLDGTSGKHLRKLFSGINQLIRDEPNRTPREVFVQVGVFGSGKSRAVKDLIVKKCMSSFFIITPRKFLAQEFRKEVCKKNQRASVFTFETALQILATGKKKLRNSCIVIDEIQLFPPGYLDLVILNSESSCPVIIMGDPLQSTYDNEGDRVIFSGKQSDLERVLLMAPYEYLGYSYRFKNPNFKKRLPCNCIATVGEPVDMLICDGYDAFSDYKNDFKVVLVPSFRERRAAEIRLGNKHLIMTYGESTGATYERGAVVINSESLKVDIKRMLVALSRFSCDICIINNSGIEWTELHAVMNNSVFTKFCMKEPNSGPDDLERLLPGEPIILRSPILGKYDEMDREERLEGDPWLKTMINLGDRVEYEDVFVEDIIPGEISFKTHVPTVPEMYVKVGIDAMLQDKYSREQYAYGMYSDQFKGMHDKSTVSNHPDSLLYEAIYPRHKSDDTVTFMAAKNKRLVISSPEVESEKLQAAESAGVIMAAEFLKHVPLDDRLDQQLLDECTNDFETKKLSKSIATLANHSSRSSSDWPINQAMIFMKSQLCTKFDNRFRDFKAGQTLACFSHIVLARFAPFIRYIEKKLFKALPENFYIHSGKNFDDLNAWVLINDFSGACTESDYEAFDSSQDATVVAFELEIMKHLNLPVDFIEDYKWLKLNLKTKFGDMGVMRFTGEAATFLFNTMANMLFTFLRYDIRRSDSIAFAGDDMCANSMLMQRTDMEYILEKMTLKAKVCFTDNPTFCGWSLSDLGIYKRPQLVCDRIFIAKEKGKLAECLDNYAIEASFAYLLGERLVGRLSDEELSSHYLCVREIIKNKHLLKSSVRALYANGWKDSLDWQSPCILN